MNQHILEDDWLFLKKSKKYDIYVKSLQNDPKKALILMHIQQIGKKNSDFWIKFEFLG